ncbi:MAG TPA: hypothetical protein VIU11_07145 [Nakamurella sp.]
MAKRREFVARADAGDCDAIIMTRTSFEMTPVSRAAKAAYLDRHTAALRQMLDRARHA